MTRREIKGQPTGDQAINLKDIYDHNPEYFHQISPYGKPGDLLWVREKFMHLPFDMINEITGLHYSYFADCDGNSLEIAKEYGFKWKPSIHLPKSASRIWAMVEEVRVERLQDITMSDAKAEGIKVITVPNVPQDVIPYKDYQDQNRYYERPDYSFLSLWASINGPDSWQESPWVWVIKYRILSKTGRPTDKTILHHYLNIVKGEKNYMTL
jgi:hypothetical protein